MAPVLVFGCCRLGTLYERTACTVGLLVWRLRWAALLFELNYGLAAGDGNGTINDGTFGDSDAFRDDVGVDDGRGADLQFVLDDQLAGDPSRNDCGKGMNLPFPLGLGRHAQGAANTAVAPNRATDDERTAGFDVTGEVTPLRYERW